MFDYESDDDEECSGSEYEGSTVAEPETNSGAESVHYELPNRKTSRISKTPKGSRRKESKTKDIFKMVPEVARVTTEATDRNVDDSGVEEKLAAVDQSILAQIRKALTLSEHAATTEAEAKAALRNASRLMNKINITQADLIAQESQEDKAKRGGISQVEIMSNDKCTTKRKSVQQEIIQIKSWHGACATAMTTFFDVKCYSTTYSATQRKLPSTVWSFYGIAENTTAAAYAFEMVFNTIWIWSYQQKELKGRIAYNSYREGVARGLYEAARADKKAEKKKAIQTEKKALADRVVKEEEERQQELARLAGPTTSSEALAEVKFEDALPDLNGPTGVKLEEVDDLDAPKPSPVKPNHSTKPKARDPMPLDDVDGVPFYDEVAPDFYGSDSDSSDSNVRPPAPHKSLSPKPVIAEVEINKGTEDDSQTWQSSAQLTRFRKDAEAIADEFIKSKGNKISKGRKRKPIKVDEEAYQKGKEDSKKIDVKRRRLEEAPIVIKDEEDY